ncbi:hypothetical protein CQW23_24720 [Capsicum baccatum]|uniref:U3 small nucleolar RNA-associated protein 6-like protein n=1 Tax=Capsicum baccatum TaxID=33114 RepID=A0A2G2VVK5_CAPBA|nr:hypothetical protein CQW23_24720 [Capsicum baccatum]
MADVVQYKMERMLHELDDLEKRGLFSHQEIEEIVKQRRKFEYRLKRPRPLKQDFVAYIDYEKSLDSLRLLRKKALMKKTGDRKLKKSVSDYAGVSRIIDIYRLATRRFKGDIELWFQYLEFCRDRRNGRMKKLLVVYEKAETMGCITEDLACQYVSFLLQLEKVDEARTLAAKFCSGKFSEAVRLWALRFSTEMRFIENNCTPNKAALSSFFEPLRNVLLEVPISEAETIWLMALKYFSTHKKFFHKLVEISMISLAKYGGSDDGFSLSATIVNFVLQSNGFESARELYKRFLALPHPGLSLYKNCIELELNLASNGDMISLGNARKLFDTAVTTYDHDVGLWQDYYNMEVKVGNVSFSFPPPP